MSTEHPIEKNPPLRTLPIVAALGLAAGAAIAAAVPEIRQVDRQFAPAQIRIAKGSPVRFVNDERVIHHAFVESPAFAADTGDIPPGESREIVFDRPGIFHVMCAIHPRMHLVVEVSDPE